jgi:putative endonuclease
MSYATEIGRIGEELTADYLSRNGYIITRRNYRTQYGEIDIVAETPDTVVFVEVKTRKIDSVISPNEAVDLNKQYKIAKTAKDFLKKAYLMGKCRFDIAEVTYRKDEDGNLKFSLNYIKNAFAASVDTGI